MREEPKHSASKCLQTGLTLMLLVFIGYYALYWGLVNSSPIRWIGSYLERRETNLPPQWATGLYYQCIQPGKRVDGFMNYQLEKRKLGGTTWTDGTITVSFDEKLVAHMFGASPVGVPENTRFWVWGAKSNNYWCDPKGLQPRFTVSHIPSGAVDTIVLTFEVHAPMEPIKGYHQFKRISPK